MNTKRKEKLKIFVFLLFLKTTLELGFYYLLTIKYPYYRFWPDIYKYMNGVFWTIILYFGIKWERKASSFFLLFMYVFQILPITVIYGLYMGNAVFYNTLCTGFWICEWITFLGKHRVTLKPEWSISKWIIPCLVGVVIFLMFVIYKQNGLPPLTALNIYDVYKLRKSGSFIIGHYMNIILSVSVSLFIPILIAKSIIERKYIITAFFMSIQILLYLYTGHKTYFFSIILAAVISIWSKRDKFMTEFFIMTSIGIAVLTFAAIWKEEDSIFDRLYDIVVRRVMFTPAELKFVHYDYFRNHDFLGLQGVLPVAMILKPNPFYLKIVYPFDIGRIYFNAPEMSADTGTFIEGFSRFGDLGTIAIFLLIALYLRLMDSMQDRTDYRTVTGFFICPIYSLAEGQLMGSLFGGCWFWILCILLFYSEKPVILKYLFGRRSGYKMIKEDRKKVRKC